MTSKRRFAPMGLWTLPGCGKPWTASKSSKKKPSTASHEPLENRLTDAGFPRAPTGRGARVHPLEEAEP